MYLPPAFIRLREVRPAVARSSLTGYWCDIAVCFDRFVMSWRDRTVILWRQDGRGLKPKAEHGTDRLPSQHNAPRTPIHLPISMLNNSSSAGVILVYYATKQVPGLVRESCILVRLLGVFERIPASFGLLQAIRVLTTISKGVTTLPHVDKHKATCNIAGQLDVTCYRYEPHRLQGSPCRRIFRISTRPYPRSSTTLNNTTIRE